MAHHFRKKYILLPALILLLSITLTGCMPPGYTAGQVSDVTKEHADSAAKWFEQHLPEAEVLTAKAYADGQHVYSIICGKYRRNKYDFDYYYEFKNDRMYLSENYIAAAYYAKEALSEAIGVDPEQLNFFPAEWAIPTTSLDDRDPEEYVNASAGETYTNELEVLPAEADPKEYGKAMIYEGWDCGEEVKQAFSLIYVDDLPPYDAAVFQTLRGIYSLRYIRPVSPSYDDISRVTYRADSCTSTWLHFEKLSEDVSLGYLYDVEETYDEYGNVIERSDPTEGKDKEIKTTSTGERVYFTIPGGADALVLAPAPRKPKKEYTMKVRISEDSENLAVWDEETKFDWDYLPGEELDYFGGRDVVLPRSEAHLYYDYDWGSAEYVEYNIDLN